MRMSHESHENPKPSNSNRFLALPADQIGIWASGLCMVHCILTPVVLSISAVSAHFIPSEERTHRTLALLIALVGAIALVKGMALPKGCSEPRSALAAAPRSVSMVIRAAGSTLVTVGVPCVSVPVLSKKTVSSRPSASR